MYHQEFEPPEELRNVIKCFWHNKTDFGETESNFEIMPDGYAEIIFHFGNGCSILQNGTFEPLPSPFIMGLLNKPAIIRSKNCLEVIGVRCFPWTVFDLLTLSSGKEEVHILKHPIAKLQSLLNDCILTNNIEQAITLLREYFLQTQSQISSDNRLIKAGTAMTKTNGNIPVSQVANEAHTTIRTLERNFKQSSGHTIKDVSALMRFEQARNQLWLDPDTNLAGLAHELGYTDQSHLNREFKRYSGTTPSAFARKGKKERQTLSTDFVAFIQS